MADSEGKERLTNNEFLELIPHLPLPDLLRIEYRKDKWYQLVSLSDPQKKLYGCMLCSITNSNLKNLNAHFEGKKHKLNLQEVKQLFHPEYTYMKHEQKLAAGDATPTEVQKPVAKQTVKVQPKSQGVTKATAPNTVKTLVAPIKTTNKPATPAKIAAKLKPSVNVKPNSTAVKSDVPPVNDAKEGVSTKSENSPNTVILPKENANSKSTNTNATSLKDSTTQAVLKPKPTTNVKTAAAVQPKVASKPTTIVKPTGGVKPTVGAKPASVEKPSTAENASQSTGSELKPVVGAKTATPVKTAASGKPVPAAKPATAENPSQRTGSELKPAVGTKSAASVKPTAGAKSVPLPKSATVETPNQSTGSELKPVVGVKSATPVKSSAGAKTIPVVKPATAEKPSQSTGSELKPMVGVKTATSVKTAANGKPVPVAKPATVENPPQSTGSETKPIVGAKSATPAKLMTDTPKKSTGLELKPATPVKPSVKPVQDAKLPAAETFTENKGSELKSDAGVKAANDGAKPDQVTKLTTAKTTMENTGRVVKPVAGVKSATPVKITAGAKPVPVAKSTTAESPVESTRSQPATVTRKASPSTSSPAAKIARVTKPPTPVNTTSSKTPTNARASPNTKPETSSSSVSKTTTTCQKTAPPVKPTPKKTAEVTKSNVKGSEVIASSAEVPQPNTTNKEVKSSDTHPLSNEKIASGNSTDNAIEVTNEKRPVKESSSNTKNSTVNVEMIKKSTTHTESRFQNTFSDDVQFDEMPVQFDTCKKLVKNPCALLNKRNESNALKAVTPSKVVPETNADVIIIDTVQSSTNETAVAGDNSVATKNGSNIADLPPKPQRIRHLKRSLETKTDGKYSPSNSQENENEDDNINSEESLAKKSKIVINPAAVYLDAAQGKSKFNEKGIDKEQPKLNEKGTDKEKPNYQTERIIIPTIHKTKPYNSQSSDTSKQNTQPKFSSKTYSIKPSDNNVIGLIGVEYVVKILKHRDDKSPIYECGLCEIVLDGRAMQNHLVGYNHRLKFCEKHFPTAIRHYKQYMGKIPSHEHFKVLTPILKKLAVAIEEHHGRDLPYECLERNYNINRNEILSKVFSCRHASDQHGPSFTHVVDSKEIDKYIAERSSFRPPTGPYEQTFNVRQGGTTTNKFTRHNYPEHRREHMQQSQHEQMMTRSNYMNNTIHKEFPDTSEYNTPYVQPMDDEIHKQMVADFLRGTSSHHTAHRTRSPHDRQYDRERRSRRSRDRLRHRSRSRSHSRQKSISPLRDGDIWQAYRHLVDQKVRDLKDVFKLYRKDPETHPMYNDEWQKFWKRRKDELIAAGLDHRSYDYQPEWVRFFKVRIEELYTQELENIKIQSRERLCLPMTNDELADTKYHVYVQNVLPDMMPSMDEDNDNNKNLEILNSSEPASNPEVVPVLRLMTALEDYLGSLGPKIIELLSKALSVEKMNPAQINNVILTAENCTLLETAMEKLKGVLFAGLLEGSKSKAFKKVISETTSLLEFAAIERKKNLNSNKLSNQVVSLKKRSYVPMNMNPVAPQMLPSNAPSTTLPPVSNFSNSQTQPTTSKSLNPSIGALLAHVDKKELAVKLAATLTAQGKTDFNPAQLEQLIAVYTVMEKKKREAAAANSTSLATSPAPAPTPSQLLAIPTRKTLSDTLVDFMNPSNPIAPIINPSTSKPLLAEDSSAKQSYTAATINRYLDLMRRSGGAAPVAGNKKANEVWQNLQNIQRDMNLGGLNASQNMNFANSASNSGRSSFGFGSSSNMNSTYGNMNRSSLPGMNTSQFEFNNSVSSNNNFNINSNLQSTYRHGSGGGNMKPFASGMGSNISQQNSYVGNTVGMNSLASQNASGSLFANNNNNSRVGNNSLNINPISTSQQRNNIQYQQPSRNQQRSMPITNPNQNWVTNTGGGLGGPFTWRNPNAGSGGVVPRPNAGGTGNFGKNQNWRNN